ncbi:MAG: alginate export family protein, partial [Gemmatimonadetes bacterium]|nr:alginate export family protein [Gemmatimonadota bacterium]NIQ52703.1 alginate export family protein [Gemmatimonadota bacterium]NIU72840.1 alginate export family protein [Gammaproteobacteria bacterium]NIX43210.1 alginate export family protein [Gemmatimonadota bacterium]NIY07382.1 alginate export family protein [Gemmatimonadota bacterium]
VQVQDVRVWGGELGTTDPSADGLDLHQGWLELGDAGSGALSLRVGRQELAYGGERLVGALNWAQQARSFDGARLRLRPSAGLVLDGIGTWIGDEDAGRPDESLA